MDNLNFERMGIYDLRNYARSIGVQSPTRLKRNELIARINAIIEGVEKPEKPKDGRGRPPKHNVDEMFLLDMFVPNNLFEVDKNDFRYMPFQTSSGIEMNYSKLTMFRKSDLKTDEFVMPFDGYFVKKSENYGLILKKAYQTNYFKENVIILKEDFENFHLKDGDFVEGVCKYIKSKNIMLAKEISKINDKICEQTFNRVDFAQIKAQYPSKRIDLSIDNSYIDAKIINKICPIAFGSRAVINCCHMQQFVDFCSNLLNSIEKNNASVYLVSVDDAIEDIVEIESNCENLNVIKFNSTIKRNEFFEKLDTMYNNFCRRVECGENVVAVLYDCQNLFDNIKNYISTKNNMLLENAHILAQNKMKDIFGLSRSTENGSLTIVGFNMFEKELLNNINCYVEFMENSYPQSDVKVDIKKSYTKNVNKILSKEEFEKLENFRNNFDESNVIKQLEKLFE